MAERMIGLSINTLFDGDHNHPSIPKFLDGFSGALYSGDGKRPAALAEIGVDTDFPLRLLLGTPKKSLSREQRILAESYCSLVFGRSLGENDGLWTYRPGWKPTNPGRIAAPLDGSVLDADWMLSLGIGKSVWEKFVLISVGAMNRQTSTRATVRHLLMLSVFGFSDPYQFFTSGRQSTGTGNCD